MNTDLLDFIPHNLPTWNPPSVRATRAAPTMDTMPRHRRPSALPSPGRNSKFLDAASLSLLYVMTRPQANDAANGAPSDEPKEVTWVVCADPMALDTPSRRLRLARQLRQARAAMGTIASCETGPALGLADGDIDAGPA
jgi:hypothetical protein